MCRGYWTLSIIGVLVAGCATDEQQGLRAFACATVEDCADGYVCDLRDRVCTLGSACGDGVVDTDFGEVCDDGLNLGVGSSGCAPGCRSVGASCGDGVVQVDAGEQCDDGGTETGDGCDADCLIEFG